MRIPFIIFLVFISIDVFCQDSVLVRNRFLIDSLEKVYLNPCISYQDKGFSKKKIKRDVRLLKLLNKVYRYNLSSDFKKELLTLGFTETVPEIRYPKSGGTMHKYYRKFDGYLRCFVQILEIDGKINKESVLIATDTKFSCLFVDNTFMIFYVDFVYIKQLLKYINFPLRVAWSNTELESVKQL
jgi:hypothetical protein